MPSTTAANDCHRYLPLRESPLSAFYNDDAYNFNVLCTVSG
jgi:hypothetical protein